MLKMPSTLLAIDTNAKTVKGQKLGYMTGILYLAPYNISGHQVCAMAEIAGCIKACLYSAGRGAFNSVQQSRINKTNIFFEYRAEFMIKLVKDIIKLRNKAIKNGFIPLVRLNGTSDIKWENISFVYDGVEYANIMEYFPDITFYDYTKLANRRDIPANYDLTFSYSGVLQYQKYVNIAKAAGMRIAVVFRREKDIPAKFLGMECIGGDNSDIRHAEPKGVVVALYAKGKAKNDMTGFVVDAKPSFALIAA
jgi:hypothetical protein